MNEFVGRGGNGAGRVILFLAPVLRAFRVDREAYSWHGCMFSASKASRVNDCFNLMEISLCIYAGENMELVLSFVRFSEICFSGYEGGYGVGVCSVNIYDV